MLLHAHSQDGGREEPPHRALDESCQRGGALA